jgi:hypothetical protein
VLFLNCHKKILNNIFALLGIFPITRAPGLQKYIKTFTGALVLSEMFKILKVPKFVKKIKFLKWPISQRRPPLTKNDIYLDRSRRDLSNETKKNPIRRHLQGAKF